MKRIIVFTNEIFEKTKSFLQDNNEQFGFLLTGVCRTNDAIKLLVREFLPAEQENLTYRHGGGVCPTPEFQLSVYSLCKNEGYHLIDVHSHPFTTTSVTFSGIDDRSELGDSQYEGTFGFTSRWVPGIFHASMVFGQESIDARIYDFGQKTISPLDEIRIISRYPRRIIPTSANRKKSVSSFNLFKKNENPKYEINYSQYSRQILAFGKLGQQELAKSIIGVVGAGGLGSVVVELLTRLGVGKIICADDDIIEVSNLSRVIGSTPKDVELKRRKVELLERHAQRINPNVEFKAVPESILNPSALIGFKDADYIIGCTDTQSSRMILNSFSMQYLIPYIDLGFGIEVDENKKIITSAAGKVRVIIPGEWCIQCIGEINQREVQLELMSDFDRKRQIERGYISGVNIPDPSVIFLNTTVVSLGICEFLNLLINFKKPVQYIFYDMQETTIRSLTSARQEDCIVCGINGVFALGDLAPLSDVRGKEPLKNIPSVSKEE
ncbi:ThiF family adenylyltransferase [Candidatus Poribacteria bacterium]|nr:ThiF family adenylyltransferase [Candidatus Poribacteria bacterium]